MGDMSTLPLYGPQNSWSPSSMSLSPSGIDPNTLLALASAGGLLGGLFPSTSNTNTSGNTTQNTTSTQQGSTATGSSTNSLLNLLSSILSTTQQQQSQQTGGTTTQTTTPTMDPATQSMLQKLISASGSLTTPSLTGYQAQQTTNINNAADLQSQAVNNIMASRGLSTSPVAATAAAGVEQNRLNQITGMQQQIPILQNQLNLANLAGAASLFSTIPKGATTSGTTAGTSTGTTTGSSTQQQNQTQQGQQFGTSNTVSNQQGTQNVVGTSTGSQQQTSGGGVGGAVKGAASGILSVLPFLLLSDKKLKREIKEISQEKAIEKIRNLKGREWTWKGGEIKDSGVIAQELEEVLPDLVHTVNIKGKELEAVNYAGIIPYLIGSIQNLDARVG